MSLAAVLQGILMKVPQVALKGMCLIPCAAHYCGLGAFPSLCFSWGHATNKQVPVGNNHADSCQSTKPISPGQQESLCGWCCILSVELQGSDVGSTISGTLAHMIAVQLYLCYGDPIAFFKDLTVKSCKIASVPLPAILISCPSPCLEGCKRLDKCILDRELLWIFSEVTLNSLELPPREKHEKCQSLLF